MTEIVLQVQASEPRCFLVEVYVPQGNPDLIVFSLWALSAFDALEQARRALPHEQHWTEVVRAGELRRVALCPGGDPRSIGDGYMTAPSCWRSECARGRPRLGVLK